MQNAINALIESWPYSRFGQFSLGSEPFQAWLCLVLARSARTLSRIFSSSREAALAARGFFSLSKGPRFLCNSPAVPPLSRCFRQIVRLEENSPPPA